MLTMVGTGSEMNGRRGHHQSPCPEAEDRPCVCRRKCHASVLHPEPAIYPDPASCTRWRRASMTSSTTFCEQYFSGEDDNTARLHQRGADALADRMLGRIAGQGSTELRSPQQSHVGGHLGAEHPGVHVENPPTGMVHMLGQSVGAYTNATHGMTLSAAVSLPYYRYILPLRSCRNSSASLCMCGSVNTGRQNPMSRSRKRGLPPWKAG